MYSMNSSLTSMMFAKFLIYSDFMVCALTRISVFFSTTKLDYLGIKVKSSILRLFLPCGQDISPGFSGILNFSRRFLKEATGSLFPLTEALEGKKANFVLDIGDETSFC